MGGALLSRKAGAGAHGYHVHLGAFLSPAGGLTWALALRDSGRPRASPCPLLCSGVSAAGDGAESTTKPTEAHGILERSSSSPLPAKASNSKPLRRERLLKDCTVCRGWNRGTGREEGTALSPGACSCGFPKTKKRQFETTGKGIKTGIWGN